MTETVYHIIHPAWISDHVRIHCFDTADTVRRVVPGKNGAPTLSDADREAGCVVIAYER